MIQETLKKQDQDHINNILLELEEIKNRLKDSECQRLEYINYIKEYQQKINELELENKKLQLENNELKEKLNSRFEDQQSRTKIIIEIAKMERKTLYDDIVNLIDIKERFTLDNLLKYSPSEWLSKRNPVVVKFIETLIGNEGEKGQLEGEKLFRCAAAVDAIYRARYKRYVSEVNLAASAIKYSLAKSKTIIDIDNHILSSGSYSKFVQWQESLAGKCEPFPKGLTFIAFDNEQKGQKNYLDHGHNTVIYHTVTSFVSFNFNATNQIQAHEDPWLHKSFDLSKIEELFNITPEMQTILDEQLHNYLSLILDEACTEKKEAINPIDNLITKYNSNVGKLKWCSECGKKGIENLKCKCPQCNAQLPTLAELQTKAQETNQETFEESTIKPLNIKFYQNEKETSDLNRNPISITQISTPQRGVKVPDIFVPDPVPINPNSINNVCKVLDHIQEISGINRQERKWIAVTCDGVPYYHAQKFKKEYPGIILLPGPLHEEMNMLKAFVELNWYQYKTYLVHYFFFV